MSIAETISAGVDNLEDMVEAECGENFFSGFGNAVIEFLGMIGEVGAEVFCPENLEEFLKGVGTVVAAIAIVALVILVPEIALPLALGLAAIDVGMQVKDGHNIGYALGHGSFMALPALFGGEGEEVQIAAESSTKPMMTTERMEELIRISQSAKYSDESGTLKFPSNNGFLGEPYIETLKPGTIIDRFGSKTGHYTAPKGTSFEERSLPPRSYFEKYHQYRVKEAFDVKAGKTAPWFGQEGGGMQYYSEDTIEELIEAEKIEEIG